MNIKILLNQSEPGTLPPAEARQAARRDDGGSRAASSCATTTCRRRRSASRNRTGPSACASTRTSIRMLERDGELDRAIEFLPTDDVIEERAKMGRGLTRPELAVLLSYSKISLHGALDRLRRAGGSASRQRARALLPGAAAEAVPRPDAEASARARDHRHADHEQPRQPHGPDLRARALEETGARRATWRAPIRHPRLRDALAVGGRRGARQQRQRQRAVLDDAAERAARALLHVLADPPTAGCARHRAPGIALPSPVSRS